MKHIIHAIIFCFLLISCKPHWTRPTQKESIKTMEKFTICVNVSEKTQEKIIEGINSWDESLKRWKRIVPIIGNYDFCDYHINEAEPPEDIKHTILARTSSLGGKYITMYKSRYEYDPLTITLHELGHAFGARHMENTLMSPQIVYNYYKCPDSSTVAQVALWNNVDPGIMSWCDSGNYVRNNSVFSIKIKSTMLNRVEGEEECELHVKH